MAVDTNISMASAKSMLLAMATELETGAGNVVIKIFGTGTAKPANPDTGTPTDTLANFNLGSDPFPATAGSTGNSATLAISAATVTDTSADGTGTATWFRAYDRDGTAHIDGTVGTATSDMIINNTSITAGQEVKLTDWTLKLSRGS